MPDQQQIRRWTITENSMEHWEPEFVPVLEAQPLIDKLTGLAEAWERRATADDSYPGVKPRRGPGRARRACASDLRNFIATELTEGGER